MTMTEEEWLGGADGRAMLAYGQARLPHDERVWTMLACACCRLVGDRLGDAGRAIVEMFERAADGLPSDPDAYQRLHEVVDHDVREALSRTAGRLIGRVLWRTGLALGYQNMDFSPHVPLLRCVLGNPFRPLPPRALRPVIGELAAACYARFPEVDASYAVLGDALEESGEAVAAAHCRELVHARGCHVIDWALGKRTSTDSEG